MKVSGPGYTQQVANGEELSCWHREECLESLGPSFPFAGVGEETMGAEAATASSQVRPAPDHRLPLTQAPDQLWFITWHLADQVHCLC